MKKFFLLLATSVALVSFKGEDAKNKITLYIDAGHGGNDAGASSVAGDKESDLCLQMAKVVQEKGEAKNIHVVLIRNEDEFIKLKERAAATEDAARNSFLVSLHLSSSKDKAEHGMWLITDRTTQIDGTIAFSRRMMHTLSKVGATKAESRMIAVLHESRIPAVVVAPGYITNEDDLQKVKSRGYQEAIADALLSAVAAE